MIDLLKTNYESFNRECKDICLSLGRRNPPRLVIVTKKQSVEKIRRLYELGHRDFGENYVSELDEKAHRLKDDCPEIVWHFIGRIQSNKINKLVPHVKFIHCLEKIDHARKIHKVAPSPIKCFISMNLGESQKSGIDIDAISAVVEGLENLDKIELQGLMGIAHKECTKAELLEVFRRLKRAAQGVGLGLLSAGMSGDYQAAVEAQTDFLRIGSKIMGPR